MKFSHAHILSCVLAELGREERAFSLGQPLRILDTGCGCGGLIADALLAFRGYPQLCEIEIYGFEVQEHGAGREQYWEEVMQTLASRFPETPWADRIRVVSSSEAWPFESGFFDLAMSNQVLEHVADLNAFFAEQRRVLKPCGIGIHHFPAAESLFDPHSGAPFAHWPKSDRGRAAVLRLFSNLGIGKYAAYRAQRGHTIEAFVEEFVDYLRRFTAFRSVSAVESLSDRAGFTTCARYNWALANRWIDEVEDVWPYSRASNDPWFARVLSRFAPVTMVCSKDRESDGASNRELE